MVVKGQKLWCVLNYSSYREGYEVEVVRVGRKWIHLSDNHRADIDTLKLDGGKYSSPGQCYLSKDVYEHNKRLEQEWIRLRAFFTTKYGCLDNLTIEKIKSIRNILEC